MKIGLVAEGPADVAVLMNILYGKLGVERRDVLPIRPELTLDETDLAARRRGGYQPQKPEEYSNWGLVLEECRERTRLAEFIDSPVDEERLLVIHIDTAEADRRGYDVARPDRGSPDHVERMRARVVAKLEELLGEELSPRSRFAVAVEETEAWLLAMYAPGDRDTGLIRDPKKKLAHVRRTRPAKEPKRQREGTGARGRDERSRGSRASAFEGALEESVGLRDGATLSDCAARNESLRLFVDSLEP